MEMPRLRHQDVALSLYLSHQSPHTTEFHVDLPRVNGTDSCMHVINYKPKRHLADLLKSCGNSVDDRSPPSLHPPFLLFDVFHPMSATATNLFVAGE